MLKLLNTLINIVYLFLNFYLFNKIKFEVTKYPLNKTSITQMSENTQNSHKLIMSVRIKRPIFASKRNTIKISIKIF